MTGRPATAQCARSDSGRSYSCAKQHDAEAQRQAREATDRAAEASAARSSCATATRPVRVAAGLRLGTRAYGVDAVAGNSALASASSTACGLATRES